MKHQKGAASDQTTRAIVMPPMRGKPRKSVTRRAKHRKKSAASIKYALEVIVGTALLFAFMFFTAYFS